MLQDLLGHAWAPLGRTSWAPGVWLTSALVVGAWGWFLVQGVRDPLGGINSLWPLFGIANQLLAAIALCVATTLLVKMGRARYAWVTLTPLAWLVAVCFSGGWLKLFSESPKIGFLAHRAKLAADVAAGQVPADKLAMTEALMRNDMVNAAMAAVFLLMTAVILAVSLRSWWRVGTGQEPAVTRETPPEYLPEPVAAR